MLPRIQPIAPKRIQAPFDHEDWVFEWKADGWRCMAYIEDGRCELVSRNANVYKSFARLTKETSGLRVKNTIIDAEIACLDSEGKSVFLDLMRRRKAEAILFAFDLLWLDDEDMRGWPLLERKRRLRDLIRGHPGLLYAEHIEAKGTELFRAICARDLEGIVCKHRLAPYSARPQSWYKVLNSDYGQKRGRREMFEKFYERGEGVSPA